MTSIIYEIVLCSFLTFVSTDLRAVIYKYTHIGHRNTAGFIRSVLSGLAESSLSYFVGQKYSQLLPFCIHTCIEYQINGFLYAYPLVMKLRF